MKKKVLIFGIVGLMTLSGGNDDYSATIINDDVNYMSLTFYNSLKEGLVYLNDIKNRSSNFGSISSYIESLMNVKFTIDQEELFDCGIPNMINYYTNYIVSYENGDFRGCFTAVHDLMDNSIKFSDIISLYSNYVGGSNIIYSVGDGSIIINDYEFKCLYPTNLCGPTIFSMSYSFNDLFSMNISYDYSNYVYWSFYYRDFGRVIDKHVFSIDKSGLHDIYYISYFSDLVSIKDNLCIHALEMVDGVSYKYTNGSFVVYNSDNTFFVYGIDSDVGSMLNNSLMINNYLNNKNVCADEIHDICFEIEKEGHYVY